MISRTSLKPPASLFTRLGLLVTSSCALSTFPGLAGGRLDGEAGVLGREEGISSHSSPPIVNCLRKKGQSLVSSSKDSLASATDMGTGDDFTIELATSGNGSVRRLRDEGVEEGPFGEENSIHTLSATPPRRPNKHRRRISS